MHWRPLEWRLRKLLVTINIESFQNWKDFSILKERTCCLKKLFLDEVFGGEAVADVVGIGGGCSSGGGGKISDQFGTNKWLLFWLPVDEMVRFFSAEASPDDIDVLMKSTVSFWGIETNVFPFYEKEERLRDLPNLLCASIILLVSGT